MRESWGTCPGEVKRQLQVNFFDSNEIPGPACRGGRPAPAAAILLAAAILSGAALAADEAAAPPFPFRTEADILVVLAHPDDEGVVAPLLAREALDAKRAIVSVYVTSGRGGRDRARGLKGPAFGLARLTELHWTLDRLGVVMFHSLGRDDGVRSGGDPAAVLEAWDRDRTVEELARLVRFLRPRELITWTPGPSAVHAEHAAAGAAALLACRAAADPARYPSQIGEEGLEAWEVPEVRLVAQAEKIGYQRYPAPVIPDDLAARRLRVEEVVAVSPSRGVRYTDIAREAMKEQRSVAAVNNLARNGPFDEPLRLVRAFGSPDDRPAGLRARVKSYGAQLFFEELSAQIGDPGLARLFPVQVPAGRDGKVLVDVRVDGAASGERKVRATLEAPDGWKVRRSDQRLRLGPGEGGDLRWSARPPRGLTDHYTRATVTISSDGGERIEIPLALRIFPGSD